MEIFLNKLWLALGINSHILTNMLNVVLFSKDKARAVSGFQQSGKVQLYKFNLQKAGNKPKTVLMFTAAEYGLYTPRFTLLYYSFFIHSFSTA